MTCQCIVAVDADAARCRPICRQIAIDTLYRIRQLDCYSAGILLYIYGTCHGQLVAIFIPRPTIENEIDDSATLRCEPKLLTAHITICTHIHSWMGRLWTQTIVFTVQKPNQILRDEQTKWTNTECMHVCRVCECGVNIVCQSPTKAIALLLHSHQPTIMRWVKWCEERNRMMNCRLDP